MKRLILSGLFVSAGLFIGRIAGFAREALIASKFGATEQTDLIIIFFSTPDVLVNLLVGGAFGMALIPELKQNKKEIAELLYKQVLTILLVVFLVLSIVGVYFSENLLGLLGPGLSDDVLSSNGNIFAITFLAIPLTVAAGVSTAFLHYNNKFVVAGFGTLIVNIILIISLCIAENLKPDYILYCISFGVILGALIRWLSQLIDSKTYPFTGFYKTEFLISNELVKRYFYCVLSGGITFLIPVVARTIASQHGAGELSLVNYSTKLVDFPLAVILTVFSIILFPRFSKLYAQGNEIKFKDSFKSALLTVTVLSAAIFIPLHHFSESVVELVYGWGRLNEVQMNKISLYFYQMTYTLPFQGVNALLIAVCASRKDTLTPLIGTTVLVLLFIILSGTVVRSISALFQLMIAVYALLTLYLLLVINVKHKISYFKKLNFLLDSLKLIIVSVVYYFCIYEVSVLSYGLWVEIIISIFTSILFIGICLLSSNSISATIKMNKG